ncbi:hypothetical protein [Flavivirga spongiicola]|uniref:Uncharacterized protein n=1 Tax=Flavivirga spongiicola TaxID=421621 RepID=A0ABU7XV35_9FLAO|nr:hypothetical protein [Flavivirga sp. MEBiC05379]MDO5978693.1 hypothetical protein [Flavivirga sp. MEBiC05379]
MTFWKTKNSIESKKNFYAEIEEYYIGICENRIPNKLLTEINGKVTEKVYADYKRFWKQYPKSRKRYLKLKLEDLKHDFVYFLITEFLEKAEPNEYRNFSKILLNMNNEEFDKYEKRKYWYENK